MGMCIGIASRNANADMAGRVEWDVEDRRRRLAVLAVA